MEYLISVLLNIVGNLLTPPTKRILRWHVEPKDPKPTAPWHNEAWLEEDEKEAFRKYNRAQLERAMRILWVHGVTFFFLFGAFFFPLLFKSSMSSQDIAFSATRLAVLSNDFTIKHDCIFWFSFVLTLLSYVPIWLLSQPIGCFVTQLWDHLQKVTLERHLLNIAMSFAALSFIIAGHWIYVLFPQLTYLTSLALPFLAVFGIGFTLSRR